MVDTSAHTTTELSHVGLLLVFLQAGMAHWWILYSRITYGAGRTFTILIFQIGLAERTSEYPRQLK